MSSFKMGLYWLLRCCIADGGQKAATNDRNLVLKVGAIQTQPQPVRSMRIYIDMDDSEAAKYPAKVEQEFRDIKKGLAVANKEAVRQVFGIEPSSSRDGSDAGTDASGPWVPPPSISKKLDESEARVSAVEDKLLEFLASGDLPGEQSGEENGDEMESIDLDKDESDYGAEMETAKQVSVPKVAGPAQVNMADIYAARLEALKTASREDVFNVSEDEDDVDSNSECSNEPVIATPGPTQ